MAICNRNGPVQNNMITGGLAKEKKKKSNSVKHSSQLVGSIKQEGLSREHITGMLPQK